MSPKRTKKNKVEEIVPSVSKNLTDYDDIVSKIRSVADVQTLLKVLLIGPTGTGKTTTLATFPKPILILDFREGGTDSISDFGDEIKLLPVEDIDEVEQLYWYLYEGNHPYKTIAWENVGQAQDLFVNKAKELEGKEPDGHASKATWGNAAGHFKTWVMNYRDLPMHVLYTSHPRVTESDEEDEDAGGIAPEVGPRTMPSVATTLVGAVNVIGHTFIREQTKRGDDGKLVRKMQYALRLGPHPYYQTKVRKPKGMGITPEYIIDPSYAKLLKVTRGEWTDEEGKSKKKKKKGVSRNAEKEEE